MSQISAKLPADFLASLQTIALSGPDKAAKKAADMIVMSAYFIAVQYAQRFKKFEFDEVVNEAIIGIYRALEKFNPDNSSGADFYTYAHFHVKDRVYTFMKKQTPRVNFLRINQAAGENTEFDLPGKELDPAITSETSDGVEKAKVRLNKLPEKLRTAIRLRFEQDMTLDEIGKIMGVSKQMVHQYIEKALIKLRG